MSGNRLVFGPIHRFQEIDSTNSYLMAQAKRGVKEGLVAVADWQITGKGRLGRTWVAYPGSSLLISVLLRPLLELDRLHICSSIAALAAVDAIKACTGVDVLLKWPNDLIVSAGSGGLGSDEIQEYKLAGTLAEIQFENETSPFSTPAVVVGLGLNVNWDVDKLYPGAMSLNICVGHQIDNNQLENTYLSFLDSRYRKLNVSDSNIRRQAYEAQVDEYKSKCTTLRRYVKVELINRTVYGKAVDITSDGRLILEVGRSVDNVTKRTTKVFSAGDVVHLRTSSPMLD
ncbi:MAG: biotin--[acetyl-CoA-carboxylase] ligase [Actinobacteria bacterium]|nr:biotin--[acetyl-CoA-carboxylase] ligase [Actinomycetota bacterium]MCL6105482.1 biotin--[acetyl-CoA-carboxylase] ligase [Actinomycetota bacterium]